MARAAALAAASDASPGPKAGNPSKIARDTVSVVVSELIPMRSGYCGAAKVPAMTAKKTMNNFMIGTVLSSQVGRPNSTDEKAAFDVYIHRNF